jgi:hypothetical protein
MADEPVRDNREQIVRTALNTCYTNVFNVLKNIIDITVFDNAEHQERFQHFIIEDLNYIMRLITNCLLFINRGDDRGIRDKIRIIMEQLNRGFGIVFTHPPPEGGVISYMKEKNECAKILDTVIQIIQTNFHPELQGGGRRKTRTRRTRRIRRTIRTKK